MPIWATLYWWCFFEKIHRTKWDDCPLPCFITGGHRKYGLTLAPCVRPEVVSAGEATTFQKMLNCIWTALPFWRLSEMRFKLICFTWIQRLSILYNVHYTTYIIILDFFLSLNNSKNFLIRSCLSAGSLEGSPIRSDTFGQVLHDQCRKRSRTCHAVSGQGWTMATRLLRAGLLRSSLQRHWNDGSG